LKQGRASVVRHGEGAGPLETVGLGMVPIAAFYVLFVYLSQFIAWGGIGSLYEQHAFLLPVPFVGL